MDQRARRLPSTILQSNGRVIRTTRLDWRKDSNALRRPRTLPKDDAKEDERLRYVQYSTIHSEITRAPVHCDNLSTLLFDPTKRVRLIPRGKGTDIGCVVDHFACPRTW